MYLLCNARIIYSAIVNVWPLWQKGTDNEKVITYSCIFADLLGVTWPTADKLIKAYEDGSISLEDGRYFVDPVKRNREKEEENDQQ